MAAREPHSCDMEHALLISGRRTVVATELVTLVGLVLYIVLPDSLRPAGAAVLALGGLAVVACAGARLRRTRAHRTLTAVAAASALGLMGAAAYLHSLADEPTAIPLAGVGLLLLSFVGIVVTIAMLATRSTDEGATQ
jgi:drug/metabolite transporter (DMT)-like permease